MESLKIQDYSGLAVKMNGLIEKQNLTEAHIVQFDIHLIGQTLKENFDSTLLLVSYIVESLYTLKSKFQFDKKDTEKCKCLLALFTKIAPSILRSHDLQKLFVDYLWEKTKHDRYIKPVYKEDGDVNYFVLQSNDMNETEHNQVIVEDKSSLFIKIMDILVHLMFK